MKKTIRRLLPFLLLLICNLYITQVHAQGKSIKRIETDEQQAYNLYKQGNYKDACNLYIKTTQQRANVQTSKIQMELFIILLVDAVGLFLFLFLEKQRAYKKLVSKNMQCATRPIMLTTEGTFNGLTPSDKKEEQLLQNLQQLFEEEKIYLDKDLNINDLSKRLNTNKTILSHVINTYLRKNFPTLLNEYRVNEAIKLLMDPKSSNYKMEAISEMCGYNNRQVFHAAFKKETGVTPIDFKKMAAEKDLEE